MSRRSWEPASALLWIHKCVSKCYGSKMSTKDSGMRIRVEKDLREAFVQACRSQNRPAAEVLRDFMRSFTEKQSAGQGNLFAEMTRKRS